MKRLSAIATAFIFLLLTVLAASESFAQVSRSISTTGRRLDEFNTVQRKAERDELARDMNGPKLTADERRRAAAAKTQIKEDFEALQSLYNEAVTRLSAKVNIDTEYVGDISGRVSKHTQRLLGNIFFPEGKHEKEKTSELRPEPRDFLRAICTDLYTFLTSPIFETGVMDASEAQKARRTLERIENTSSLAHRKFGKVH